jgi:hypothetical protein
MATYVLFDLDYSEPEFENSTNLRLILMPRKQAEQNLT